MDCVFSDEASDYPAGSYVRHPPGSFHKPFSQSGCILFVKLLQMHASDSDIVMINTKEKQFNQMDEGLEELPLYENPETGERVKLLRLGPAKAELRQSYAAGAEFFVIEGAFEDENGAYAKGFWLRLPPGSEHKMRSERGCLVFMKTGHLGAP
jgi:anti-sigma factor ChrR (cupin superfamily)